MGYFVTAVVIRLKLVIIMIVSYYFYKLSTNQKNFQSIFQFSYMMWCIIHFLGVNQDDQIKVAAYFVFPAFIFDQIYSQTRSLIDFVSSEGKTKLEEYSTGNIMAIFFLMVYTFLLTYESRKKLSTRVTLFLKQSFGDKTNKAKKEKSENHIEVNISRIYIMFAPVIRYCALIQCIVAGLQTLNLPNSVLILCSFLLLKTRKYDDAYWHKFLFFNIFLILMLYFSRLIRTYIHSLNSEVVSIFGFYALSEEICMLS